MWRDHLDNPLARQVLPITLGLALRVLFSPASFDAVARSPRSVAFLVLCRDVPYSKLNQLWERAREAVALFTPDERTNPIAVAIRELRKSDPHAIVQFVHD